MEKNLALIWGIVLILAILTFGTAHADGKLKAATCTACHGPEGISSNPLWPNIAKQKRDYLVKQLKAFRGGERKDPLMSPIAQTLTDNDIEELASYFSGL